MALKGKLFPIGLGTAQLDQEYGFDSKLSEQEQEKFMETINKSPINFIDTAPAYGNAEKVVGKFAFGKYIATKLSKIPLNIIEDKNLLRKHILDSVSSSLKNLNVDILDLLLVHQSEPELIFNQGFKEIISELKGDKISSVGVSVYEDAILQKILDDKFYDAVEVNFSIIDQRKLKMLKQARDKLVICRSVFLRGMLTCPLEDIPSELSEIRDKRKQIEKAAEEIGIDYLSAVINYPLCVKGIDIIILGMNRFEHVAQNTLYLKDRSRVEQNFEKFKESAIVDEGVVDPRRWKDS